MGRKAKGIHDELRPEVPDWVSAEDVLFFELGLAVHWFRDSLRPGENPEPPEIAIQRIRGLLRRPRATSR